MRVLLRRRAAPAGLGALAAVALAACGGSGATATTARPSAAAQRAAHAERSAASARPAARPGSVTHHTIALPGGTLSYTLVLPNGYRPGRRYPLLLALPPGDQSQELVDTLVNRVWAPEAKRRGWIVVSPAAPASGLLFEPGPSALLPPFLAQMTRAYPPEGGRVHLAGVSNGGLAEFRVAIDHPKLFSSLLGFPAAPPTLADYTRLRPIAKIPVALYVGGEDTTWLEAARETVTVLRHLGGKATLTVSPGEGHIITRYGGRQYFDALDRTR
jgi:poly(3-hydroxybutyrate) depolymerase